LPEKETTNTSGKGISRRGFVKAAAIGGLGLAAGGYLYSAFRKAPPLYPEGCAGELAVSPGRHGAGPNIIVINADDLGYGDPGCYGGQAIRTPNIDGLAGDGVRFTDFHTCDAVCTPSRAGLLTGRYPARMFLDTPLHPGKVPLAKRAMVKLGYMCGELGLIDLASEGRSRGLSGCEITLAEALGAGGYRTGMVGKWHLGDYDEDPAFNPLNHGFDYYFGVPYSNDMNPFPLYRGTEVLEENIADQSKLTGLYTEEAIKFIESAGDDPFFLYFAHTFPHRPLFASEKFSGSSDAGVYGDAVQEVDWSVGRILETLKKQGKDGDTIVIFTSDNGPWYQGSPGAFRGRKGQSFEGGHRVPFIARWPGRIPAGSIVREPAMNIDLFPTLLAAAGVEPPTDRIIDGEDITGLLTVPGSASPHDYLYFYHHGDLEGVRSGKWKYFRNVNHYTWPMPVNKKLGHLSNHTAGPLPLLFNLDTDPGEAYNLAEKFPDVARELDDRMTEWEKDMEKDPSVFK